MGAQAWDARVNECNELNRHPIHFDSRAVPVGLAAARRRDISPARVNETLRVAGVYGTGGCRCFVLRPPPPQQRPGPSERTERRSRIGKNTGGSRQGPPPQNPRSRAGGRRRGLRGSAFQSPLVCNRQRCDGEGGLCCPRNHAAQTHIRFAVRHLGAALEMRTTRR